jgi:hypothetical protein
MGRRGLHRLEGLEVQGCQILHCLGRVHCSAVQFLELWQRRSDGKAIRRLLAHRIACARSECLCGLGMPLSPKVASMAFWLLVKEENSIFM